MTAVVASARCDEARLSATRKDEESSSNNPAAKETPQRKNDAVASWLEGIDVLTVREVAITGGRSGLACSCADVGPGN